MESVTCAVEGCEKPARARGWCMPHYHRWNNHGDPIAGGPSRSRLGDECAVDGCDVRPWARGWCRKHYKRWLAHGDPTTTKAPGIDTGRRVVESGHIYIRAIGHPVAGRKGWAMEHRVVAWDAGLLTDLSLIVHHINGDPADNRVENLAVMTQAAHAQLHALDDWAATGRRRTHLEGAPR